MANVMQLLAILVLPCIAMAIALGSKFNVIKKNHQPARCSVNGTEGLCLHESVCIEEGYIIMDYGNVDYSDFRTRRDCPNYEHWCCFPDTSTKKATAAPTAVTTASSTESNCLAPQTDVCPWCVLLYTSGRGPRAHRPFCMGALIGGKGIITASSCLLRAKNGMLYAQVPNSAQPGRNYTVLHRRFHPGYNTGSHQYDIGLLVMESDVALQKSPGACLDFLSPLRGECLGYGFDINWKITSTILQVKKKGCSKAGGSRDAACGSNADKVCSVEYGGPILCPTKNQDLYLRGIARGRCDNYNTVLLGGISHSKTWIEETLNSMDISKDLYVNEF